MPALLLLTGPKAGLRLELEPDGELAEGLIIGRSPSCALSLQDERVSRRHVRVWLQGGRLRLVDLGSRNGTIVNGEKAEGEVLLLPGDRVQVGDTTVLVEPRAPAALADREAEAPRALPLEDVLLPGPEAALCAAGVALLGATSEAMVLRRAAQEALRALGADESAALLGGTDGLLTAAVVGAERVEVPRGLAEAALERRELVRAGGALCAPLVASGGVPFGLLYAERGEGFGEADARLLAALARLAGEAYAAVRSRVEAEAAPGALVGGTRPLRRVVEQARRAAATNEPVTFWGEPGVGKRLAVRYLHARSARALGPLVVVDCRAPRASVEEELFGRAGGPGVPPRPGALLRADGGTLLLQHADALPRHTAERVAALLLRRVALVPGGGEEPVDVRPAATSRASLALLAAKGEVEPELARAFAGADVEVPPLRERRADVPPLFEHFAGRAVRGGRRGAPVLSPEARARLMDYGWPHNVRELELLAQRVALLHEGGTVDALMLPPEVQGGAAVRRETLAGRVARLERDAVVEALREARGKKIRAAQLLGISRPTLDKKIAEYGLVVERRRASGEG